MEIAGRRRAPRLRSTAAVGARKLGGRGGEGVGRARRGSETEAGRTMQLPHRLILQVSSSEFVVLQINLG
jgi:hypothetical protein